MKVLSRIDRIAVMRTLLAVPLLLAGTLTVSGAANAQSLGDVDSRLSRVERVLDQSLLVQLQRVDGLERELRQLRGEIEGLYNEIATLKRRNQSLYQDTDNRLTELEDASNSGALFGTDSDGSFSGLDEGALQEGGLDETGGAAAGSSSASGEASRGVFVSERSRTTTEPTPIRTTATQAEKAAYTRAYDLLARGQNAAAVSGFDEFLNEYPDGPYSFNAWYWKGEAMYSQRRFDEAIDNFRQVTEGFPTSTKVPDARLKIGYSLYEQGDFASARQILEQVQDQYVGRSAAVLARKRLQKMDREGQ